MGDLLIEGSLIGPVYGNIFLEFSVALKKDSEQLCLNLLIIDIHRVMGWMMLDIIYVDDN